MKSLITLMAVTLISSSCVNLSGRLNVTDTLIAKKRGGFLNLQMKKVEIAPGIYRASLKVNNGYSFTLKLAAEKEGEQDILIPIKSEKEFNLPSSGDIKISGEEISQPFNVVGNIETEVTNSDTTRTTEDCTYSRVERHCDKVCSPVVVTFPNGSTRSEQRCDVVCHDVTVSFPGTRFVEYHYRYTNRSLRADLVNIESQKAVANFSGTGTESDRVNEYIGECR